MLKYCYQYRSPWYCCRQMLTSVLGWVTRLAKILIKTLIFYQQKLFHSRVCDSWHRLVSTITDRGHLLGIKQ